MNGAVWLKATNSIETIVIRNALINAEYLDDLQSEAMVEQLARRAKHR
jgi:hypothetical protein